MKYIIGIDPGLGGGLALLRAADLSVLDLGPMPTLSTTVRGKTRREVDASRLTTWLKGARRIAGDDVTVALEVVSAMPGQGVSSMFAFGRGLGRVEGVCAAIGLEVRRMTPQTWRGIIGLRGNKNAARALATKIYPEHEARFRLVKDDGVAEAALIANAAAVQAAVRAAPR